MASTASTVAASRGRGVLFVFRNGCLFLCVCLFVCVLCLFVCLFVCFSHSELRQPHLFLQSTPKQKARARAKSQSKKPELPPQEKPNMPARPAALPVFAEPRHTRHLILIQSANANTVTPPRKKQPADKIQVYSSNSVGLHGDPDPHQHSHKECWVQHAVRHANLRPRPT